MRGMTSGDQRTWPRITWLRGLAVLCVAWLAAMIGLAVTGVLIFGFDVGMSETVGRWIGLGLEMLASILFVGWRRTSWLAEDKRTSSTVDSS